MSTQCSAMNPINAEGNMFSNLFDKVPAKRAGVPEDVIGTVLYLVSKAGVALLLCVLTVGVCQWAVVVCRWRTSTRGKWSRITNLGQIRHLHVAFVAGVT